MVTVSAIVLNYRTPQETVRCVQALLKQTMVRRAHHDTFSLDIIVVDNHSEDDSIGVLRNRLAKHPNVCIVESTQNIGYGQGNMLGTRFAGGDYIYITNPDNELEPTGLEKMIQKMETDNAIGILAPRLVHEDGTTRDSARAFPRLPDVIIKRTGLRRIFAHRLAHYLQSSKNPSKTRETDWIVGASFLIRRSIFKEVGGFDPRFFLFFEDIDLCRRVREAGHTVVYFPEATATDRKRRLSEGGFLSLLTSRTARVHVASALKYFWKWRGYKAHNAH
jgi:GT2 family glycosyltransferase